MILSNGHYLAFVNSDYSLPASRLIHLPFESPHGTLSSVSSQKRTTSRLIKITLLLEYIFGQVASFHTEPKPLIPTRNHVVVVLILSLAQLATLLFTIFHLKHAINPAPPPPQIMTLPAPNHIIFVHLAFPLPVFSSLSSGFFHLHPINNFFSFIVETIQLVLLKESRAFHQYVLNIHPHPMPGSSWWYYCCVGCTATHAAISGKSKPSHTALAGILHWRKPPHITSALAEGNLHLGEVGSRSFHVMLESKIVWPPSTLCSRDVSRPLDSY